jgi:hypothetical protein
LRAFPGSAWGARDGLYPGKHLLRGTRAAPRPACPHWARTGGREARAEWGLGPPGPALRGRVHSPHGRPASVWGWGYPGPALRGRGRTTPTGGPRAFGAGGTLAPLYGAGGALPPCRTSDPSQKTASDPVERLMWWWVSHTGVAGRAGREWATAGGQEVGDALLLARAGGCWPSRVTGPAGCRGGPRPASPRPCPSAAARPGRRSTTARLGPGRSPGPCRHRGTARGTTAPP